MIREFVPGDSETFAEDPTSVALRRFTDGLYRETAMNEFVLHRHPTLGLERQVDLFDVAGEYDPSPVAPE